MAEPSRWTPVPAARWAGAVALPGRCLLENGSEYACLASDFDASGAEIACAGLPGFGEQVVCDLDGIGPLRGRVEQVRPSRFRIRLDIGEARRARIMARIAWQAHRSGEQRATPRLVPVSDRTQVCLADRRIVTARICDLSMAGVALRFEPSADVLPPVGAVVRIGLRYATVVRPTATGFAARFRLPFSRETFSPELVL